MDLSNTLDYLCNQSGLHTNEQCADYFDVSLTTWIRMKKRGLKKHQLELLRFKSGYLNHKDWKGIRFKDGYIWNVFGQPIHVNQVNQIAWLLQLNGLKKESQGVQMDLGFHRVNS